MSLVRNLNNHSSFKTKTHQRDEVDRNNRNDKTIETNLLRIGSAEVLDFEGSQASSIEILSMANDLKKKPQPEPNQIDTTADKYFS